MIIDRDTLKAAEPHIRALARVLKAERREIVEALEAHASIEQAPHQAVERQVSRLPHGVAGGLFRPKPKFEYVRSDALMRAYRLIPCQHCGADDGTVCGAHANWAQFGKGRSVKASDIYAASLCHTCHFELDQGTRLTEAERKAMWWEAHIKTMDELLRRDLWPAGIPIPDVTRGPF